jgi:hypothetical protein
MLAKHAAKSVVKDAARNAGISAHTVDVVSKAIRAAMKPSPELIAKMKQMKKKPAKINPMTGKPWGTSTPADFGIRMKSATQNAGLKASAPAAGINRGRL